MRIVTRAAAAAAVLALTAAAPAVGKVQHLYGLRYGAHGNTLTPYDPISLRAAGRPIALGPYAQAWSVSLDRTRFVAAAGVRRAGEEAALRFVDLEQSTVTGTVALAGERRRVAATAWVRGRVLAVVSGSGSTTVYSVDPVARSVVGRVELDGVLVSGLRTEARLVLLLAPPDAIGPATIATVDQSPRARTTVLERVSAGTVSERERVMVRRPGIATSPSGRSLYVFGGGEPAAAVDLRTLAVRYAPVRRTAALQKRVTGSVRAAATLPDGRVVVWGSDYGSTRPVGVSLVRPRDWSSRLLHPHHTWIDVEAGLIFTRLPNGVGLRMQRPDGAPVELFRTGSPASVDVVGPRALVRFFGRGARAAVVALGTGRVVGHRVPANLLLERGQPIAG